MPTDPPKTRPVTVARAIAEGTPWALARMRQYLRSPRFWAISVGAIALTVIVAPFESDHPLTPGVRTLYWSMIILPGILTLFQISIILREGARRAGIAWGWPSLVTGVVGGLIVLGYQQIAQHLLIGPNFGYALAESAFYSVSVTTILSFVANALLPVPQRIWGMRRDTVFEPLPREPEAGEGPLFGRLPLELGRNIVWVRADNHHIELCTTRGVTRILMRLADAEAELATLPGLRVHRSWWANISHATHFEVSERSGHMLLMIDGTRVPVSRGNRAAVEEAMAQR